MLQYFRPFQGSFRQDFLSGLTVALALVPEAIAFAFVAGVSPLIGLYSAFFMGLITAIVGGRPGMISGATGAMAVVVVTLVAKHGVEYLFPAVILCGLLQIAVGMLRLGKLIRMVPHPVMLGFVNGLAIVIGLAQLSSFQTLSLDGTMEWLTGTSLMLMLVMVGITMAIIAWLPRFTQAVPASLAAILFVSALCIGINQSGWFAMPDGGNVLANVGDLVYDKSVASGMDPEQASQTGISGGLPLPFWMTSMVPPLDWQTLQIIFPYALVLCGVGLIESLMTLTLIDEITSTRGRGNKECIGQGVSNLVCGVFGGMGGCAMIGQSLINVNSGGRGRLSGITAAVCLLLFVMFLSPWIAQIPIAALVGVMFMVVIGTFEWASLKMFSRMPASDLLVMILVTGYTVVMHDLASAVILGVIVSALVFAWKHATHMGAEVQTDDEGQKTYQLHGPLFFASVTSFKSLFNASNDPEDVVIDFYFTRVYDQSGLEAIHTISEQYTQAGKRLQIRHLSNECRDLLDRAGDLVTVDLSEDPHYHVATDRLG